MESIKVFVRVRPLRVQNNEYLCDDVAAHISSDKKEISVEAPTRQIQCRYDHVFAQESTQAEIYHHVRSSMNAFLSGINSTIFAYGQTGSGKTYTMMGRESCIFDEPGIVPRCINDIFQHKAGRNDENYSFSVFVSFIQVYNEQVYDMLDDPKRMKPLAIHERSNASNISIPGLTEYHVHSYKQCLALIEIGLKNRALRETAMNNASSRSHSILQVTLEQTRPGKTTLNSKLNLVDLAGSERWSVSHSKGKGMGDGQISELTNINSSLYTLGRCIAALASKSQHEKIGHGKNSSSQMKHIHVPYRDSKLTRLLQDSLGGNSKIILVATINPSSSCADESISTLRFADRAHQVMTFAQVNENVLASKNEDVKILQQEIARLKNLLRSHGISDTPQTQVEQQSDLNSFNNIHLGEEETQIHTYPAPIQYNSLERDDCESNFCVTPIQTTIDVINDSSLEIEQQSTKSSHDHKKTCEKIIDALDMVVTTVDSFLRTMKLNNIVPQISSTDLPPGINMKDVPAISNSTLNNDTITTPVELKPLKRNDVNTIKPTMTSKMVPKESGRLVNENRRNSLTSLLQQRKKLQGVDVQEEKLKEQIQMAKKQQQQKLQLHQWLLEKEEKTQYPYNSLKYNME